MGIDLKKGLGALKRGMGRAATKNFWKHALHSVVYFAASMLVLNDLFLMLARTFVPDFMPEARVIVLEKLVHSLMAMIGGA